MNFIKKLYSIFIEALFPLSQSEKEVLGFSPEEAFVRLPQSPQPPFPGMDSVFAYKDERVTKLIWHIKYKKSPQAVKIGGYAVWKRCLELFHLRMIAEIKTDNSPFQKKDRISSSFMDDQMILVIPMPITDRRRRERGFNQCELIVDEISKLDKVGHFIVRKDILVRSIHASRQTLKHRLERMQSAKGIFSVNEIAASKLIFTSPTKSQVDELKNSNFLKKSKSSS